MKTHVTLLTTFAIVVLILLTGFLLDPDAPWYLVLLLYGVLCVKIASYWMDDIWAVRKLLAIFVLCTTDSLIILTVFLLDPETPWGLSLLLGVALCEQSIRFCLRRLPR